MKHYSITVRKQLDGYYWRVDCGDLSYSPPVNTAKTAKEARAQARRFTRQLTQEIGDGPPCLGTNKVEGGAA